MMNIPYMSLDDIYKTRQAYNWQKIDDGKYIITHIDKAVRVEQRKEMFSFSCSEEDFYSIWYRYFDLETSYDNIHFGFRQLNDTFKVWCNRCSGIHILRQELFYTIVAQCIAVRAGYKNTKKILSVLESTCGKKHRQSIRGEVVWHEFPSAQQILKNVDKFKYEISGYEKDIILSICNDVVDGKLCLGELKDMDFDDAYEYLMCFDYMSNKSALLICLYSLHHMQSFPPFNKVGKMIYEELGVCYDDMVEEYFEQDILSNNLGYIRQVLLYNKLYPVTDGNRDMTQEKKKRKVKRRV